MLLISDSLITRKDVLGKFDRKLTVAHMLCQLNKHVQAWYIP